MITQCPRQVVPQSAYAVVNAVAARDNGSLPQAGGWLDQDFGIMRAIEFAAHELRSLDGQDT